jgi:hypothetical protein
MMNQLLMQMMAARGGTTNPMLMDLLARMNAPGGCSSGNFEDLLAQQAATNPMAAMLAKQLAEQKAARASEEARVIDVEAEESVIEEPEVPAEHYLAELNELRERFSAMSLELELLRQRNDTFAAAVGACPLCWGQKSNCRSCRGRGRAGFCIPDECLFEEFVLPAIRTLKAQMARNKVSPLAQARAAGA